MTKKLYLYGRFFASSQNFSTKCKICLKFQVFPDFLVIFVQNLRFFFKNFQIPGFLAYIVKLQVFPGFQIFW